MRLPNSLLSKPLRLLHATFIYIYMYIRTCIYICTWIVHVYIHVYIRTCTYMYICIYTCTCMSYFFLFLFLVHCSDWGIYLFLKHIFTGPSCLISGLTGCCIAETCFGTSFRCRAWCFVNSNWFFSLSSLWISSNSLILCLYCSSVNLAREHTHIHMYIHTRMYWYTVNIRMCIYMYIYMYVGMHNVRMYLYTVDIHVCM